MEIQNSIWYFGLLLISLLGLMVTLIKISNRKRLIQTYFFIAGLAYVLDLFVLILFNAYHYKPGFVPAYWFDTGIGSIISQGIVIPIAATVIAGFNVRFFGILFTSILFIFIEELFLFLGIYEQHWWETWYTGVLLFICFYIAKFWYQLLEHSTRMIKFVIMYLTLVFFTSTIRFFGVLLFSTHIYSIGWFSDPIRDHITANALFLFIYVIPVTAVVMNFKLALVLLLVLLEGVINFFLIKSGVLYLASYWNIGCFILLLIVTLIIFRFIYTYWFSNKMSLWEKEK